MPIITRIPAGKKIEVLGVTLTAQKSCKLALDDPRYTLIPAKDDTPCRIIPAEGDA